MKITLTDADTGKPFEIETTDITSRGNKLHNGKITNCITVKGSAADVFIVENPYEIEKQRAMTKEELARKEQEFKDAVASIQADNFGVPNLIGNCRYEIDSGQQTLYIDGNVPTDVAQQVFNEFHRIFPLQADSQ